MHTHTETNCLRVINCKLSQARDEAVLNIVWDAGAYYKFEFSSVRTEYSRWDAGAYYKFEFSSVLDAERGASFSKGYDGELRVQVQFSTALRCEL